MRKMSDINLLPEDLREGEVKARAEAQTEPRTPVFSRPTEKSQTPLAGEPPGRWQQLMSALKKNMVGNEPVTASVPPVPSAKQPPVSQVNKPIISTAPLIKEITPQTQIPAKPGVPVPPAPGQPKRPGGMPPSPGRPTTILDVNLLPAQEGKQVSRQAITLMSFTVLAAVAIVVIVYFSLRYYVGSQQKASEDIQQEVIALQQELEAARGGAEQALATQHRISELSNLLNQQSKWQNFFDFLEQRTIPTVVLSNLAADANGQVTLSGTAPDLTEVGRQMLAYQQSTNVLEVTLNDVAAGTSKNRTAQTTNLIKFTFALKLKPSLFVMATSR